MSEISIHIGWEYFLGIIGTLIGIAYNTNGRLTRLETTVEWVKDTLTHLSIKFQTPTEAYEQPQSGTTGVKVGRKASTMRKNDRIQHLDGARGSSQHSRSDADEIEICHNEG